jgi:hypothetical protein
MSKVVKIVAFISANCQGEGKCFASATRATYTLLVVKAAWRHIRLED